MHRVDVAMVTESGDVPVPVGARWAAVAATASGDEGSGDEGIPGSGAPGGTRSGKGAAGTPSKVINVSNQASLHVDVGEDGMVLIEWLFDSDETEAH